ncbi:beta strand repeat-containing protein [uncultured Nostoc sp.]|uniref:beta strand repeat-containing protein n=1 Tax=uncultured Nostoc sp. TaxID=340711 RepID=UPI0035CA2E36
MAIIIGTSGNDTLRGTSDYFSQYDTLTGNGGNDIFFDSASNYINTITDFGGVGKGTNPTAAVIAEVDILSFQNNTGFTAQNLILTQNGNNLEISFQGFDIYKFILENFALSNLDNLNLSTGATVDLGNILFSGQTSITDSFDVFNANFTQSTVFKKNTVTFLNELDNNVSGFDNSNDVINGQGGNDIIEGLSGNDILRGGAGNNTLNGGVGDDTLYADSPSSNNRLFGGNGNDSLFTSGRYVAAFGDNRSLGNNTLNGGIGDDSLDASGSFGDNLLDGGDGNDTLTASDTTGNNTLNGGNGDDSLTGGGGKDSLTGGGGKDKFVYKGLFDETTYISDYTINTGTHTIADFTGVGEGINPTAAVIAEVDTLIFQDNSGFTADNLLLTQNGTSLSISFQEYGDTRFILENFALSNLDNLSLSTGATVDLGNILFSGQTSITDSFDVFDANSTQSTVFKKNTVTFLNDIDNNVSGFDNSNDVINGQAGDDIIQGLSGNDILRGGDGNDTLNGGDGNDTLNDDIGNNILNGGSGDDFLNFGSLSTLVTQTVDGGTGNDFLSLSYSSATTGITSTFNPTTNIGAILTTPDTTVFSYKNIEQLNITGTNYDDYLVGSNGNDTLRSGNGNDTIDGGAGEDFLDVSLSTGNHLLNGGDGNDSLRAWSEIYDKLGIYIGDTTSGNNTLNGGVGDDTLDVSRSADDNLLNGGDGNDSLTAFDTYGNNTLIGGVGDDTLYANYSSSANILDGGDGDDSLIVASNTTGNNTLNGGNGDDTLRGGSGDAIIIGGKGNDRLFGEGGIDTFVFNSFDEGLDLIRDFGANNEPNELIQMSAAGFGGGLSAGVLQASQFTLGESATTSKERFIYNSTTGALFFDSDGSANAFTQVQFAGLSPGLSLTNNNFVVV